MAHTSIVLADDHQIVRSGIRNLLDAKGDFDVVGEAASGREAVELILEKRPDVALVDIQMPDLSGVEVIRRLSEESLPTRTIVLSMYDQGGWVEEALRAGAAGYVVKTAGFTELIRAIEVVRAGGSFLSPTVTAEVVCKIAGKPASPGLRSLSERETEVLRHIAEGYSSREIGRTLGLSLKTVDSHRASIMTKLDLHKVSLLVRFAVREGLVGP